MNEQSDCAEGSGPVAARTGPDGPIPFALPDLTDSDVEAVVRVLRSGWLTTGDESAALEQELADYLGVAHVIAVSSCTAALEIAFAFLHLPPGARVGVPTWTFAATALAPTRCGATPVLLDVAPDTLNVSPHALAAELERGLDAVVPVHFGGVPVDARVHSLCQQAGVPVVEDAAHALGAVDHRGQIAGVGSVGACYSFYATKNLTSGEGGALATEGDELADFARSYRLHGLSRDAWARYRPGAEGSYELRVPGIKANLPDILAALARSQLARLDDMQARRRALTARYREQLSAVNGIHVIPAVQDDRSADHLMVVALPEGVDRDAIAFRLRTAQIGTSIHFQPLHQFSWFREHAERGVAGTSIADAMATRVLSLPLHPGLKPDLVDRVCDVLVAAVST